MPSARGDRNIEQLLDELAANATPATTSHIVDGWIARISPTLPFRRANSVLTSLGEPTDPVAAIEECEAAFARHGLRSTFQVSTSSLPGDLDTRLAARGYQREAPVSVLVATIDEVASRTARRSTGPGGITADTSDGVDATWIAEYARLHGSDPTTRRRVEAYGEMLAHVGGQVVSSVARREAVTIAVGFGVVERSWIGIFGMGTAPQARRTGASSAVLGALVRRAAECGASRTYLQVERENAGARALYAGVGFQRSHGYHYRRAPRSSGRFTRPRRE